MRQRQTKVRELEAKEMQTESFASNSYPQETSYEPKRTALVQITNSNITSPYLSSVKVFNIEKMLFDGKAEIALSSARTHKDEGAVGSTRKIHVTTFLLTRAQAWAVLRNQLYRQSGEIPFIVLMSRVRKHSTSNR